MNSAALNTFPINDAGSNTIANVSVAFTEDQSITSSTVRTKVHVTLAFASEMSLGVALISTPAGFTTNSLLSISPVIYLWEGVAYTSEQTLSGTIRAGRPFGAFSGSQDLASAPQIDIPGPGVQYDTSQDMTGTFDTNQKVHATVAFVEDQQLQSFLQPVSGGGGSFGGTTLIDIETITVVES